MNKSHSSLQYVCFLPICALIFLFSFICTAQEPASNPDQSNLAHVKQQIDSIEVEMQIKKRNGETFEDLEEKTAALRDTVAHIKNTLVKKAASATQVPIKKDYRKILMDNVQSFKSGGAFDWIIIGVGIAAILSGLILVLGIVRASIRRRKKSHIPTRITQKIPIQQTEISKNLPDTPRERPAAGSVDLDYLRKLMDQSSKIQSEKLTRNPFPIPQKTEISQDDSSMSQNDRIINAARGGLDIQEISRRYHVSTDQIALILKVAKVDIK